MNRKILNFGVFLFALSISITAAEETNDKEILAGDQVAALYLGTVDLIADKKVNEYVNLLGRHLADQTERPELPWVFGILDTDSVNAFCAPGGKVFVTRGLYQLLETFLYLEDIQYRMKVSSTVPTSGTYLRILNGTLSTTNL